MPRRNHRRRHTTTHRTPRDLDWSDVERDAAADPTLEPQDDWLPCANHVPATADDASTKWRLATMDEAAAYLMDGIAYHPATGEPLEVAEEDGDIYVLDGDDTLGSCGCVDYHLADCPTRTGGSDMTADDYDLMFSSPGYDPYYDDNDY